MSALRQRLRSIAPVTLAVTAFCAVAWWILPWCVPQPERLMQPPPRSPVFLATDGTPMRQLLNADGQRAGAPTDYKDLPLDLIHATLAAEDKRFFSHGGVDLLAVARAAWDNAGAHRVVSGASTVTQQLVKISASGKASRSLLTKLVEALQARRLEMTWSKERILTEYLNRVGYGNLLTGCAGAAQGCFHKPLRDLTPAECALLAALPQSPTRLNPFRNLRDVQKRQQFILRKMHELRWLNDDALKLALAEKPVLQRFTGGFEAPHVVEMLAGSPAGAPVIQTTIVPRVQVRVEAIIEQRLSALAGKHVTQAAAVVIENKTGQVLALAGSRDYFAEDGGQLNGAWVPHSPGSALKPFTYLLALDRGFTPASVIADLPIEYATPTGLYRPENYDKKNYGPVTLRDALGNSLNIPAVRVLQQIGGENILCKVLQDLGLTTLTEPAEHYGLGLTIGNAPVRLIELANAYACLARLGEWKACSLTVPPSSGNVGGSGCRKVDRRTAYLIADILSDPQARMISFGPHTVIRMPFQCAVKTGTSTNYRDNWTLGFTPEFTVGVWCGNFDNSPMHQVSGVTGAGPIFREVMMFLHETRGTSWYAEPDGMVHARIDPRNGKRLDAGSPPARVSREELFVAGTLPPPTGAGDYDADGRAVLPPEFGRWIALGENWLTGLVIAGTKSNTNTPPHILSPADGSVFFLDPDLPGRGARLLLRTEGGSGVRWTSQSLAVTEENGSAYLRLTAGQHEVCAEDAVTGAQARVRIEVREPVTTGDKVPARTASGRQTR